jgi:hypothetical protein
VAVMAFGEKGRREGLHQGLITPDSLLAGGGGREKGRWIEAFAGVRSTPDRSTVGVFDFEKEFAHRRHRIGGREFS